MIRWKADLLRVEEKIIHGELVKVKIYDKPKAYLNGQLLTDIEASNYTDIKDPLTYKEIETLNKFGVF